MLTITIFKPTPYKDLCDSVDIPEKDFALWETQGWLRQRPVAAPAAPVVSLQEQIAKVSNGKRDKRKTGPKPGVNAAPPVEGLIPKPEDAGEKPPTAEKDVDKDVEDILSRLDASGE